jgi:hypothetical protein
MAGVLGVVLEEPRLAILIVAGALFMVFVVSLVVRRRGLAIAIGAVLTFLTVTPKENFVVELPFVAAEMAIMMTLLFRFGLLAAVMELWLTFVILNIPHTLDPSRYYFGYGIFSLGIVLGFAIYGFRTSLGAQKALGDLVPDE